MAATGFKFFQLLERHGAFKGALVGEIHYVPFWFVTGTLRVVVLACRDELGLVRVGRFGDHSSADAPNIFARRMVEDHAITDLHLSQMVAGHRIADPRPDLGVFSTQVSQGEIIWFTLDEKRGWVRGRTSTRHQCAGDTPKFHVIPVAMLNTP